MSGVVIFAALHVGLLSLARHLRISRRLSMNGRG
jgi:hypothetical protein